MKLLRDIREEEEVGEGEEEEEEEVGGREQIYDSLSASSESQTQLRPCNEEIKKKTKKSQNNDNHMTKLQKDAQKVYRDCA